MTTSHNSRALRSARNPILAVWIAVITCSTGPAIARAAKGYEFAAGEEVTVPFAYSAKPSSAPRPVGLDFTDEQGYPDNCEVFVRIDGELWEFKTRFLDLPWGYPARYKGPDIDHLVRQEDAGLPAGYLGAWFLGGMWYDESEHKLYAPMHIESEGINRDGPVAPWPSRKVILATSADKGRTWHDEGDIITPETYYYIHDAYKFSGSELSNGLCDFGFYADVRGGYFYVYPMEGWLTKGTWTARWSTRVARCAIRDKMAPGKWKFFYDGGWDQPALGGKSSAVSPSALCTIYSTYLRKYVAFTGSAGSNYIGICSDLSTQDWRWVQFPELEPGCINVLDQGGDDPGTCGQSFRIFSYSKGNTFHELDVTLKEGQTAGTEIQRQYSYEPHPESSDRILGRQTKFVGSDSGDLTYVGTWANRADPLSYEGHMKECASAGSVALTFEGSDVYWRGLCSPDSGLADVYVDDAKRKTVDCYSAKSTEYEQFAYLITGLAPNVSHTIKVVVRGEKNSSSKGTAVRHIGFEFAAESYKASAGFSSLMGKNNWRYEEWDDIDHHEMHFCERTEAFTNYWFGKTNQVGPNYQSIRTGAAVREWVAPMMASFELRDRSFSPELTKG